MDNRYIGAGWYKLNYTPAEILENMNMLTKEKIAILATVNQATNHKLMIAFTDLTKQAEPITLMGLQFRIDNSVEDNIVKIIYSNGEEEIISIFGKEKR